MKQKIEGIIPVMLTPFDDQGEIDWGGLEALIEWYLEKGAEGLFGVCHSGQCDFGYPERGGSINTCTRRD